MRRIAAVVNRVIAIAGKELGCRSATEQNDDLLRWASLPEPTTSAQLAGGVEVTLRNRAKTAIGYWSNSVHLSPETFCRGVVVRDLGRDDDRRGGDQEYRQQAGNAQP